MLLGGVHKVKLLYFEVLLNIFAFFCFCCYQIWCFPLYLLSLPQKPQHSAIACNSQVFGIYFVH